MSPIAEAQKTRVYELAKEVGLDSRRLIDLLRRLGITVRNHMSTLEPEWEAKVRDAIRGGPTSAPPPPPKPPAPRPVAPPPRPAVGVRPSPSAARAAVRPGLPTLYPGASTRGQAGTQTPSRGPVVRPPGSGPRPALPPTSVSGPVRPGTSSASGRPGVRPPTTRGPLGPHPDTSVGRPPAGGEVTTDDGPMLHDGRRVPKKPAVGSEAGPGTQPVDVMHGVPAGQPVNPGQPAGPERPDLPTGPVAAVRNDARDTEATETPAQAGPGVAHPEGGTVPPRRVASVGPQGGRPQVSAGGPTGRGASAPYRGASAPYRGPATSESGPRPASRGASAPYRGPNAITQGTPRAPGGAGASAPYRGASAPYRGTGPGTTRDDPRPGQGGAGRPAATAGGRPGRAQPAGGGRPGANRYAPPAPGAGPAAGRGKGGHRRGDGRGFGRPEDRLGERENFRGGFRPRKRRQVAPVRRTDRPVVVDGSVTVGGLAQQMGVTAPELIRSLMGLGVMATVTQEIDADTAALAITDMGYTPELRDPTPTLEQELEGAEEDREADLEPRAPVVTVMGHVDHGKTSLLDAIREANVTAGEAGGITQHIGAYSAQVHDRRVVFLDTPGHEAFTSMRARGAQVTDIVILVVAADDGPMPQTIEAINHAKAASVPIVVAINKMDVPGANPDRVKQSLTEHGLVPEEWGGDTLMVPVSAHTRSGLPQLLESVLLVAELRDLKANPHKRARGTVIEARLDKGRGPVATILVTDGTLHVGDSFVVGAASGRVRAMFSAEGQPIRDAGPSTPVEVVGLEDVPEAGDRFVAVDDERKARTLAEERRHVRRREGSKVVAPESLDVEELFRRAQQEEIRTLLLVVKADVQGSLEAVIAAVERLTNEEVQVRIVHRGVGAVTESDVMLAAASQADVIGFNVRPDPKASRSAEQEHVSIRTYRIIYELLDDLRSQVAGLRKPTFREDVLGRAEVRQIFHLPKGGTVAGIMVENGRIVRSAQVRVLRDGVVVHEGKVGSLRRFKDDVREIASGYEGGVMLERFGDIKEGDVLEFFVMEEEAQEA